MPFALFSRRNIVLSAFFVSAAFCIACAPQVEAPCDVEEGAVCAGSEVLLCVCPAPDDEGLCPEDDATWQVDELCSCSLGSMTCQ